MMNKRKAFSLFGESAREIGILILVFVPLDLLFRPAPEGPLVISFLMGSGIFLITAGILVETWEWKTLL